MKTVKIINESWNSYDKTVAGTQLNNFGVIFLDDFGSPIDDEFELEELYEQYKNKKN